MLAMSHATTATLSPPGTRPRLRIVNARRVSGGQLRGIFDEELLSGFILLGCKLFNSGGTIWCKPPDTSRVDRDGRAMLRPDGKRIYDECIDFTSTAHRNRWREQTLAALAIDAPELLEYARSVAPPPQAAPAPVAPPRPRDDLDDPVPF
jgi:hypothetical protein